MGYDTRAVKVDKSSKRIAILSFDKEIARHYIREVVKCEEKNARMRSARNKGEKED